MFFLLCACVFAKVVVHSPSKISFANLIANFDWKVKVSSFLTICIVWHRFFVVVFIVVGLAIVIHTYIYPCPWQLARNKIKCGWLPVCVKQHLIWWSAFFCWLLVIGGCLLCPCRIIPWLHIHINSVFNMIVRLTSYPFVGSCAIWIYLCHCCLRTWH